ncbi:ATP-dependent zinc protease [Olivibacter sp. SDN3]|uniref:ATP-dependent zinc protease family protein n=1 Tax=Olivibacter sp. SDN3 TaxID=2764720 RepID=UPI001650E164|nr:RimK/LysX family protein [Olivibacter sp. SDN3]QNL49501.1 ATP-dependent zinc protease [Olivibacter sp. SDN3]
MSIHPKNRKSTGNRSLKTIGWKESVDFIELGIQDIPAKIDTGAKTSVLHCKYIELVKIGRKSYVKFVPLDEKYVSHSQAFTLPFHKERKVKNSFGSEENRFIIKTNIRLFNESFEIEISLRDRSDMEYPVLLGRSFLRRKFLVDVSKANLSRNDNHKSPEITVK